MAKGATWSSMCDQRSSEMGYFRAARSGLEPTQDRAAALVVVALVVVALAACSSTETQWAKPGPTAADFNRASYECAREATLTASRAEGSYRDSATLRKYLYRACLENRGYER
jgi:hypothetical protein